MSIFSGVFKYLKIYRRYIGRRLYLVFVLTAGSALGEGLGIALLLPLLKALEGGGAPDNRAGRILYDVLTFIGLEDSVLGILLLIGLVFFTKAVFMFAQIGYRGYLQAQLMRELKKRMFDAYSRMDYRYYIQRDTGHFINVINEQVGQFFGSFNLFSNFLSHVVMSLSYLTMAFLITWRFALMAMGTGFLMLALFRFLNVYVRELSLRSSSEMGHLNKLLVQALQAFKYLVSTYQMGHLREGIMQSIRRMTGYRVRQQLAHAFTQAVREPVAILFIIGIVVVQVVVLEAPLAPMIVAILLFYRGMGAVIGVQGSWQDTMSLVGGVEMVDQEFGILADKREAGGTQTMTSLSDGIELRNVSFGYNQEQELVLKQVNVHIPVNTTVAIVGKSGAGKSTLIDLLTLLLKPQLGSVLIDGVPGHEVDLPSWRNQIGYVSQETVVFDDTIANNISLWTNIEHDNTSRLEQVREASRKAHIADFVESLPEGYETLVGDRGIRLSGGQRQRLFIARELFKKPNLLILDEATSALDTESERYIQESIDALKGQMTVVIIAHRLSTIRKVDYLYVLDRGEVIEEGTYRDLRDKLQSRFREMVEMQAI